MNISTYTFENFPDERVEANRNSVERSVQPSASQPLSVSVGVRVELTVAGREQGQTIHRLDVAVQVVDVHVACRHDQRARAACSQRGHRVCSTRRLGDVS